MDLIAFSVLQSKIRARKKSAASYRFYVLQRAQSASGAQFVQAWKRINYFFTCHRYWCWRIHTFFNIELKILYQQFPSVSISKHHEHIFNPLMTETVIISLFGMRSQRCEPKHIYIRKVFFVKVNLLITTQLTSFLVNVILETYIVWVIKSRIPLYIYLINRFLVFLNNSCRLYPMKLINLFNHMNNTFQRIFGNQNKVFVYLF